MSDEDSIFGVVKLRGAARAIPKGGLTALKHRIELAEKKKPDLGWMAELTVLGSLPWGVGGERQVKIRIMSPEFRDHVISKRPSLLVRRRNEVLGDFEPLT